MSSPAVDIAQYLENNNHGTIGADVSGSWSINISREPSKPDQTVTLYDSGGDTPEPDANATRPAIQLRVRARDYLSAYDQAFAVRNALITPKSIMINGRLYVGIWATDDISLLRYDDNNRAILVANFDIFREA